MKACPASHRFLCYTYTHTHTAANPATVRSKTAINVELNVQSDGGANSERTRWNSGTPEMSFPFAATVLWVSELSRGVSGSQQNRKWALVGHVFLCCVTSLAERVQSTWLLHGNALWAENRGCWIIPWRKNCVTSWNATGPTTRCETHDTKSYEIDFYALAFNNRRNLKIWACNSTFPFNPQLLYKKQRRVLRKETMRLIFLFCANAVTHIYTHFKLYATSLGNIFLCYNW